MKTKLMTVVALGAAMTAAAEINVIPMPQSVIEKQGAIASDDKAFESVEYSTDPQIPAEGYRLTIGEDGVKVASSDEAGRFYANITLRQLRTAPKVPYLEISDAPRFPWRGLLFDDGRHFFGKEALMKTLDAMAYHKLNRLHWILTQDQGWRIEIKRYPRLTEVGSVRPASVKPLALLKPGEDRWTPNNIPYGPYFYTQEDIREIVAYAAERHIQIIPEIEFPGHSIAALAAYPELGCTQEQLQPWWRWGVSEHIYCGGNDKVIEFLAGVLDEVCGLFPGDAIHIGGDEAPKSIWKTCPKCQARIKELGLNGEEGLQGWMVRHFTEYLAKKGKRAISWEESLAGAPATDTIIMGWLGTAGGIKAATIGHDVVMTPIDPCYLDNPQGLPDDPYEYINYGFVDTLQRCYAFDPAAGFSEEAAKHILGSQGNNWSEYTWDLSSYEWKIWPRMSALAECFWTNPARKDWTSFRTRLKAQQPVLRRKLHLNSAPVQES